MLSARLRAAWSPRRNLAALVERKPEELGQLDGIRAMAALWVLTFHCVSIPLMLPVVAPRAAAYAEGLGLRLVFAAHFAIDAFLVLAGFLMAHLLLVEKEATGTIRIGAFARRRFLRIVPLLATVMVIYMIDDATQRQACTRWGWSTLTFVNNFVGPQIKADSCLGHSWTLAVEFQLYLLSPFLIRWVFGGRTLYVALVLSLLVALGVATWYELHPAPNWYTTAFFNKPYTRAPTYLEGMIAAFALHRWPRRSRAAMDSTPVDTIARSEATVSGDAALPRRNGSTQREVGIIDALVLLPGLALVLAPGGLLSQGPIVRVALIGLGRAIFGASLAYLIYRTAQGGLGPVQRFLAARAWLPVARLAYGAYLVQFVVVSPIALGAVPRILATTTGFGFFAVLAGETIAGIALSFAVGLLVHLAVEKPCLELRPRRSRGEVEGAVEGAAA